MVFPILVLMWLIAFPVNMVSALWSEVIGESMELHIETSF